MIRAGTRGLLLAAALALSACASAPVHYYTLVAPITATASESDPGASGLPFDLLPVGVPAQVDMPQLVVRQGGEGVLLLDGQRWIAPLGDEVRAALAADLTRALPGKNVSGLPDHGKPVLRIKLDLRRFDSQPGGYALLEGSWSMRLLHADGEPAVTCSSVLREEVGPGYDALVRGHQRAIARLAAQVAAVAHALFRAQPPACPAG